MLLILAPFLAASSSVVSTLESPNPAQPFASFVTEASQRFGVPEAWIYAVMAVESRRNLRAVSPKGAQGLMQLMPPTWAILRAQLGLGDDPFDAHDNIIAGTAYLRALYDRYGATGFLAAYNAGPGRYEDWLKSGRVLPSETQTYVARLMQTPAFANLTAEHLPPSPIPVSWTRSALFVTTEAQADGDGPASPFKSAVVPFATVSPTTSSPSASTTTP